MKSFGKLVEKVELFETGVEKEHFKPEQLAFIDLDATRRFHLVIRWKDVNDEVCMIIRDLLKIQYSLNYKWLSNVSYKYVAQKTNTNGNETNLETANILIEPLNNDFKSYISRIPINQKLENGTEVILNKSIGYTPDKNGIVPERKFLHSGNLEFDTKIANPVPKYFHIGAMEIGSNIRAKFVVQNADTETCRFRLFSFLRKDAEKVFVLQLWKFYGLTFPELIDMMIDYLKNRYVEPKFYTVGANDYGANVMERENLIQFLTELNEKVKSLKATEIKINDFIQHISSKK